MASASKPSLMNVNVIVMLFEILEAQKAKHQLSIKSAARYTFLHTVTGRRPTAKSSSPFRVASILN